MNLLKRTAVGIVGVPAIYLIIRAGSWYLLALVTVQAGPAARGFYPPGETKQPPPPPPATT